MKYVSGIVGLLIAAASAFGVWSVMQPTVPAHVPDRHLVYLFSGGVFFGALLIIPTVVVGSLKSLMGVIGPYLPVTGGHRASDPPAPPKTDGST